MGEHEPRPPIMEQLALTASEIRQVYADVLGDKHIPTNQPKSDGWCECWAVERETGNNPSAAFNVLTGFYNDLGSGPKGLSLIDFLIQFGGKADAREAILFLKMQFRPHLLTGFSKPEPKGPSVNHPPKAATTGTASRTVAKAPPFDAASAPTSNPAPTAPKVSPLSHITPSGHLDEEWVRGLVAKKPGITYRGLHLAGAQPCMYPKGGPDRAKAVYYRAVDSRIDFNAPVGLCIQKSDGGKYPSKYSQGKPRSSINRGSSGIIGRHGLQLIKTGKAQVVWRCEGVSDLVALQGIVPPDLVDSVAVISSSSGATELKAPKEFAQRLSGLHVILVGDCDTAGQRGVDNWSRILRDAGSKMVQVIPPWTEVVAKDGQDLRDLIATGKNFSDLLDMVQDAPEPPVLTTEPEPVEAEEAGPEDVSGDESTKDVELELLAAILHSVTPERVTARHFGTEEHRLLFRVLSESWAKWKTPPSLATVRVGLTESGAPAAFIASAGRCLDAIERRISLDGPAVATHFDVALAFLTDRLKRQSLVSLLDRLRQRAISGEHLDELVTSQLSSAWDGLDTRDDGPRSFDEDLAEFTSLHESIVEGVARRGEVVNIVSNSKSGKTWFLHNLALCLASGRDWFGHRISRPRNVLLIDNELHKPTLVWRIKTVAEAMGLEPEDYTGRLRVEAVRGKGVDVHHLDKIAGSGRGWKPDFVGIDSLYRFLPPGTDENSNGAMKDVMEKIIRFADERQAMVGIVAHSSKGDQSEKSVTDVGSGAGSVSRAADCHLVMRQHKEDDCVVMEARVRSYSQPEPKVLRWNFPLWTMDEFLDPKDLRTTRQKQADDKDAEAIEQVAEAVQMIIGDGRKATITAIRTATGWRKDRVERVVIKATKQGSLTKEVDGEEVSFRCQIEVGETVF